MMPRMKADMGASVNYPWFQDSFWFHLVNLQSNWWIRYWIYPTGRVTQLCTEDDLRGACAHTRGRVLYAPAPEDNFLRVSNSTAIGFSEVWRSGSIERLDWNIYSVISLTFNLSKLDPTLLAHFSSPRATETTSSTIALRKLVDKLNFRMIDL